MTSAAILAIETATSACSVALSVGCEGERRVFREGEVGNNIHSQQLLSMVEKVLGDADVKIAELQAVAVGQGPGSFTGLRIGVGVAQGIAYGAGCPMVGVSSLDALAWQVPGDAAVLAGIDARMGEVYWCEYLKQGTQLTAKTELSVSPPSLINSEFECVALVGNAWSEYAPQLRVELLERVEISEQIIYPHAASILELAYSKIAANQTTPAIDFMPLYVRNDVAKKSQKNPF